MEGITEHLDELYPQEKQAGVERLTMLSDGIFAIALTLLVLDLKIPEGIKPGLFNNELWKLALKTLFYLITFTNLGRYWNFHRRLMHMIKRIDSRFIQLSLLYLASVALFPAAMNLTTSYGDEPISVIIYTAITVICGFMGHVLWFYATSKHRLVDITIDKQIALKRALGSMIFPVYISLSLLLLLIPSFQQRPYQVYIFWLSLPIVITIIRLISSRFEANRGQSLHEGEVL